MINSLLRAFNSKFVYLLNIVGHSLADCELFWVWIYLLARRHSENLPFCPRKIFRDDGDYNNIQKRLQGYRWGHHYLGYDESGAEMISLGVARAILLYCNTLKNAKLRIKGGSCTEEWKTYPCHERFLWYIPTFIVNGQKTVNKIMCYYNRGERRAEFILFSINNYYCSSVWNYVPGPGM